MVCHDCEKTISEKTDKYSTCYGCGSAAHFLCDPTHVCLGTQPSGPGAFASAMQEAMERKGLTVEDLAAALSDKKDEPVK